MAKKNESKPAAKVKPEGVNVEMNTAHDEISAMMIVTAQAKEATQELRELLDRYESLVKDQDETDLPIE